MLVLKPLAEASRLVDAAGGAGSPLAPVRLLALAGFATHQLAYMLDSLVRVSRRADWTPSASILRVRIERARLGHPCGLGRPGGMAGVLVPRCSPSRSTHADQPRVDSEDRRRGPRDPRGTHGFQSLPSQQFQALFTLFSKFFSSFPRGTCSLSVSRRYLALDGIYHRLGAAFPNNPTRGERLVGWRALGAHGVLTLSDVPFNGTWTRAATEAASIDYNSPAEGRRFSLWALPGSLAVTRGILVSFSSSAY